MGTGHLNDLLLPRMINEWLEHSWAGKWHVADLYLVSLYLNIIYCVATIILFPVIFPLAELLHYLANENAFNHTSFPLIAATKHKAFNNQELSVCIKTLHWLHSIVQEAWMEQGYPLWGSAIFRSIGLIRKALQRLATRARPEKHEEVSVRICQSHAVRIILLILHFNVIGCPLLTSRWEEITIRTTTVLKQLFF